MQILVDADITDRNGGTGVYDVQMQVLEKLGKGMLSIEKM